MLELYRLKFLEMKDVHINERGPEIDYDGQLNY